MSESVLKNKCRSVVIVVFGKADSGVSWGIGKGRLLVDLKQAAEGIGRFVGL